MRVQTSFDYFVGAGEERRAHFEVERLGGFQIDEQLEFAGLINRDVARLGPDLVTATSSVGGRDNCLIISSLYVSSVTISVVASVPRDMSPMRAWARVFLDGGDRDQAMVEALGINARFPELQLESWVRAKVQVGAAAGIRKG
ncbi:hypothetical protein Q2941_47885 [Bradyrhizobium sp. UFLA05-153]